MAAAAVASIAAGAWLNPVSIAQAIPIFGSLGRPFASFTGVDFIYALVFPDIASRAAALDRDLATLREDIIQSLHGITDLGGVIQGWIKNYPSIPTDPAKLEEFTKLQDAAVAASERAQRKAQKANNAFAPLTNQARDYSQAIDRESRRIDDAMSARRDSTRAEIGNLSPPWYVYLGGPAAVLAWMLVEENRLKGELESALKSLQAQKDWLDRQRSSGVAFQGHLQSWMGMTSSISGRLGSTYNILTGIWGQLIEDPTLYAELIRVEWAEITRNAQDVISMLQSSRIASAAMLFAAPSADSTSSPALSTSTPLVATTDLGLLSAAIRPLPELSDTMERQISDMQKLSSELDSLARMPGGDSLVCHWDITATQRFTFLAVVEGLQAKQKQVLSEGRAVIERVRDLAAVQADQTVDVSGGKISPFVFTRGSLGDIIEVLRPAHETRARVKEYARHIRQVYELLEQNVRHVDAAFNDLQNAVITVGLSSPDRAAQLIAEIITRSVASQDMLGCFDALPAAVSHLIMSHRVDVGAIATARGIRNALFPVSLDVLQALAVSCQTVVEMRQGLYVGMANLRPLFEASASETEKFDEMIADLCRRLQEALDHIEPDGVAVNVRRSDWEGLSAAWISQKDCAETWLRAMSNILV